MNETRIKAIVGAVLIFIQSIASIYALSTIKAFNFMPAKYLIPFLIAMLIMLVAAIGSQFYGRWAYAGYAVSAIAIILFFYIGHTVSITKDAIDNMGARETVEVSMDVITLTQDPAMAITDLANATFGVAKDNSYDDAAIKKINEELGFTVETKEYANNYELANGLLNGEVRAMVINTVYVEVLDEAFATPNIEVGELVETGEEQAPVASMSFIEQTKVLTNYKLVVEKNDEDPMGIYGDNSYYNDDPEEREAIDTSKLPFIVYVSGIDIEGKINTISRSDVNVLVAINPVTKQIAMITTPRDSYVEIPGISENENDRDKLTHAGLYGKGCKASIATLEKIYGININAYVRVNFTSVEKIVDLLGGVTVNSAVDFTERWDKFHFSVGPNFVNGTQALHFARERYTIPGGDYARGRNHTELIKAILLKCMSPSVLGNYSELLDTLSDNLETNFTTEEIAALVKMQLDDMAEWNFVNYCVAGINGGSQEMKYTHSYPGGRLCVTILDPESIRGACELMEKVLNGEIVSQDPSYTGNTF